MRAQMRRADGGRSDGARTWPWDEDHRTGGTSVVGDEVLGPRDRCQKHRRVTSTTPSCRSRSSCAPACCSLHPRPPASTDVPSRVLPIPYQHECCIPCLCSPGFPAVLGWTPLSPAPTFLGPSHPPCVSNPPPPREETPSDRRRGLDP